MLFKGIEICCPTCRGDLRESQSNLHCERCDLHFPILLDIPDLRVFADPYVDIESDRAKGLEIATRLSDLDFPGLVDFYYSITPAVPPNHAQQYRRGLMTGVPRARASLISWERVVRENGQLVSATKTSLLEIGCGTAPFLVAAAPHFSQLVGVDIAFRWLVVAKKRLAEADLDLPLICACAEALPFPDRSFDRLIADSVLEHVRDQRRTLRESHRVLKKTGYFFASTPNRFSLGPDPHTGIWAGGLFPDNWVGTYIRWKGGIPPKRKMLSAGSLHRLIQKTGFDAPRILLADVPDGQRSKYGNGMQLLIGLYKVAKRIPVGRRLMLWIGPFLQVVAQKPQATFSEETL